ncbi:MAG: DUF4136 domain-containing protein [Bacteroidales bacterium]|jgi:hypothetical protein|nr:DUF4136 domain-containing protein [Bacteroidales bacterium]
MKNKFKSLIISSVVIMLLGITIAACSKYPTYDVNTSDLDMVWTNYDESADFVNYKTYFLPDSIILDDSELSEEEKQHLQEYYESIVEQVVENMTDRNFVRVDSTDDPDIGMGISILTQTTYVYSYNWWLYYPPYWGYPGYGYYYPWSTYLGSYEEGAVVIDMSDLKNINHSTKQINALWAAMIGGVLTGNSALIDTRLYGYIDEAYEQSPYLLTN